MKKKTTNSFATKTQANNYFAQVKLLKNFVLLPVIRLMIVFVIFLRS